MLLRISCNAEVNLSRQEYQHTTYKDSLMIAL